MRCPPPVKPDGNITRPEIEALFDLSLSGILVSVLSWRASAAATARIAATAPYRTRRVVIIAIDLVHRGDLIAVSP